MEEVVACSVGVIGVLLKSGYRVDALVQLNGKKIGIEVDGPSHFVGREPAGSTILKRRQIPNIDGIMLLSVPYWEWDELEKDHEKKQKYLTASFDCSHSYLAPIIYVWFNSYQVSIYQIKHRRIYYLL